MSAKEDDLIARYLKTDAGRASLQKAICHGWPDFQTAIREVYIPALIRRAKRRGKA